MTAAPLPPIGNVSSTVVPAHVLPRTAPWAGRSTRQKGRPLEPLPNASGTHESSAAALQPPTKTRIATEAEVSFVCRGIRNGQVLRRQTILKADHFPSCYNTKLPEQINGAPNFRQVENMPVYGLGAPTARGLRSVCARVAQRGETVLWFNLREEPVIYIHGRPFCTKERSSPFKNLENVGIARASVEQAEAVLKQEVLAEAARFGGSLLVTDETKPMDNAVAAWGESYSYWEVGITPDTVCTARELYQQLREDGVYSVRYHRVPITDESPPHEADFDTILSCMGSTVEKRAFVFNCQLGRGRTTTGMTIACIAWRSIAGPLFNPAEWDVAPVRLMPGSLIEQAKQLESRPADGGGADEPEDEIDGGDLEWGEYLAVVKLVSRLSSGAERKRFVDCVIDKCEQMQNLRRDILVKKDRAETHPSPQKRDMVRASREGATRAAPARPAAAQSARPPLTHARAWCPVAAARRRSCMSASSTSSGTCSSSSSTCTCAPFMTPSHRCTGAGTRCCPSRSGSSSRTSTSSCTRCWMSSRSAEAGGGTRPPQAAESRGSTCCREK